MSFHRLESSADHVIRQILDHLDRVPRTRRRVVLCNQHRLQRLDCDDAARLTNMSEFEWGQAPYGGLPVH